MSNYVCKGCAATVQKNYDHAGPNPCSPDATADEWGCAGTFVHPGGRAAKACWQGRATLTHDMVMTRDDYNETISKGRSQP